jgi:hypothetical protein
MYISLSLSFIRKRRGEKKRTMCIINDPPVFCFAYQAQPAESFPLLLLLSIATGCFHFLALSSISDPTPYPEQSHVYIYNPQKSSHSK